ncbi:small subunit processome component 20 homolog isoform X1 [Carassius auratus]|uniref:Small subunit processome component 20 homolog isoform X1 n=1 Tax=Carassius auratus TaxID=7957 RepID=A0A6P6JZ38_CARAU|nr:small subunit processome component 20 homolog isoform X1 [Carassius auratus]
MKLKAKPRSHKSENTYRFVTFSERLAKVNIDVIHRIDRTGSYTEEVETYFYEALIKWKDLNLTDHFKKCFQEVLGKSQSFNMLVFHQNTVVESLKTHLSVKNSMAYQPLLDLVVQLARDLQMDFYPHFCDFFIIITSILETQDTEVLEWAFTCLSYLYKYLWRMMVKDIDKIYSLYSKLLAHKKEHIRNFAAESFSFLMRKVSDYDALFTLMFFNLSENPQKARGAGQLIFEMCRGVCNMFHSCASKALPVVLKKLGPAAGQDVDLPWDSVKEALDHMAESSANYVDKEHLLVLWDSLQGSLRDVLGKLETSNASQANEHLERILYIYHTLVEHRKGAKITKAQSVCETLLQLVQAPGLSYSCHRLLLQVVSALLMGENLSLPASSISELVKKVFSSGMDRDLILSFTKEMFDLKQFEQLFLPSLLQYLEELFCMEDSVNRQLVLELLVGLIVTKAPPPTDGSMAFEKYPLVFTVRSTGPERDQSVSVPQQILSLIDIPADQPLSDLSHPWAALVLLPHVRPVEASSVIPAVTALLNRLLQEVCSETLGRGGLFVARQALSTLLSFKETAAVQTLLPAELVRNIIEKHPTDLSALLLGDLYYTRLALNGCSAQLSHDSLLELYQILHSNFSSNISKIRLLTLRIMSNFEADLPKPAEGEESSNAQTVFAVCLQAEQVPATVQDYREKLLHLRKLRHDLVQPCVPKGPLHEVPLRYLIAMLFVNFRPLWDAVIDLLVTHAKEMDNKSFWKVYYEHLEMVAGLAEEELQADDEDDEEGGSEQQQAAKQLRGSGTSVIESGDVGVLFLEQLDQMLSPTERTDFTNFRNLLWRAMAQFPDRVEPRSRELSPLLLRFISNEFYPADLQVAPTQDLMKKSSSSSEQEMDEEVDADMEEDEEKVEDSKQPKKKIPRKAAAKQLIAHLKVFSKFSNPRALFMEAKLSELYTQLLCHKDQQVQKIALDCLMTYRDPNILPYKENLERLLDDKHFKDEIVHFNISEEGAVVLPAHRPQLIPMLMRILYGRMCPRVGNRFQGKANTASRSSIVLRFLAGCQPEEMGMFIDLLLEPVCHHSEGACLAAVERAVAETNLSAVLPLGRQHSLLNTIEMLIHKMGHLIHMYLPKVLQILLCMTASVSFILDHREQLKPGCINPLKNLRRLGILRIQDFFDGFESYSFTADELDAVFQAVVWPKVCLLSTESPYAPTPLLKVIRVWVQNPRYFPLLAKQRPGHPECDVLLNVFALLSSKNVSAITTAVVMDIAESLLTTPDYELKENESELIVNNCVIPDPIQSCDVSDSLTIGCRLLLPHIPALLQYLSGVVRNSERLKKKQFRSQVSKELNILSKISRFVAEKEQSSTLIGLLLPYLHKPSSVQETELDILGTVKNLLRQCSEPSVFLKPLSKLFSIIHNRLPRQALCEAFLTLSDMDAELKYITDVVIQLNAFDSRHLDEVHFDVRLVAFQKVTKLIKEMSTLDMRYLTAIMHNCFHSLEIGDMSLADSATMCLSAVITQLSEVGCPEAEYKEIVQYTILDAIRKGLKSKTESVRNDYTTVLACLVKTFPNRSEFHDLVQLTDYNDLESDFFEHMKHIQVYRRGRALRKFARQLTEGKIVMSSRSMQNYIMPYAMIALVDEKLLKYEPMTTAAVEVIGAVCRRLTWSKYLYYLKHFVHVLQSGIAEQKLAVSLLLTVLDAFHFDHESLSKEIEAAKKKKTEASEPSVVEEAEDEAVEAMDTDESDAEDAMETAEAGAAVSIATDAETEGPAKPKEGKKSQTKKVPPVVSSGLPQSERDLETLISTIHHTVTQSVLPKLHKCLTAKVKRDDEHKMVKSKEVKDEEVARVPIAFAMIQLMKCLPKDVMEANLPGIFLKVCVHLRSRFQEIRDVARNTLMKIIESLGHQYLHYLLSELQAVLVKGYQVHVLTFTVYHLLTVLKPSLNGGDLDPCMDMLITIFNNELFGAVAEEKDIRGIVSKVMEARHSKSSDSYELLGQFCSQERVIHLILPLKEMLENTASLKVSRRVHAVLRRIVAGLLLNESMSPQSILLLSHGLVSESLPLITSKNKEKRRPPPDPRLPPPSCLLLPANPKRGGAKAAISSRTNMHILVEAGLSLLHCSLKSSKINSSVPSVKEMLDPFVPLLLDCLNSMHVKVITEALQAFIWILKFPLPAVEQNYDQMTKQLFVLLKDYAKAGAGRGENFHLVQNCFKAITVLVKSMTKPVTQTQLQVLLGYAEEDIYDNSRQATAFGLLRAILSRKLVVPEMEDVMKKVAKFAIDGSNEQVRMRCRQIYLKYLMDYPLGKKLRNHFDFIVSQLTYEYDTGRQSALELMAFIFQKFPQALLHEHCGLFFVPLSLAMLNDDSAACKKMVALAIKSLLNQLDLQHQNSMFNLVNTWLTGEKPALRRLGAQVCGLFVEVEGEKFIRRLDVLIPLIEKEIHTSNFEDIEEEEDEKAADRLLFCYLTLIVKLIKDCGFLELHKPADLLSNIWSHIDSHLRYPHCWVWLTASQILGLLFAAHKPEELLALWSSQESTSKTTQPVASASLTENLSQKMRELVLSFCYQLQSKFLDISAGEQVVKNLLYVAKVIYLISPESDTVNPAEEQEGEEKETTDNTEENEEEEDKKQKLEDEQNENKPPSLLWVMKKLSLLAKREAADTPKVPLKRTCVFKFLGAIAVDLGKDRLGPYLTTIIAPLYRELDSTYADQDPTLKNLAQELIELLKKLVGLERFSLAFAAVQKEASQRRTSRKKAKAMQAVVNPDVAARKKIKKQFKKNEAKKRKILFVRTGHKAKKHKSTSLKDLAIIS